MKKLSLGAKGSIERLTLVDFWSDFSENYRKKRLPFSPYLPSVRKVNCRKTNKRKKNRRKRNSAGKEALLSKSNTPLGLQSRPGADLSCLRQLSAPGLQR